MCPIPLKYVYSRYLVQQVKHYFIIHLRHFVDLIPRSITGTGTSAVVASLSCSPDGRCSDINVNDISLS